MAVAALVTSLPRLAKKLPVRGDGTNDLRARRKGALHARLIRQLHWQKNVRSAFVGCSLGFAALSANLRCLWWAGVRNPDGRFAPKAEPGWAAKPNRRPRVGCRLALGFAALSANLRCLWWAAVRNSHGRLAPKADRTPPEFAFFYESSGLGYP